MTGGRKIAPGDYAPDEPCTPKPLGEMNGTKHLSIRCPSCGSDETLRVAMTLGGAPATFTSCSYCDWRGWEREGQALSLDSVISLVSTD